MIQNAAEDSDIGEQTSGLVYVDVDVYQACILNMNLPKGFKIEKEDVVRKDIAQRSLNRKNYLKI